MVEVSTDIPSPTELGVIHKSSSMPMSITPPPVLDMLASSNDTRKCVHRHIHQRHSCPLQNVHRSSRHSRAGTQRDSDCSINMGLANNHISIPSTPPTITT